MPRFILMEVYKPPLNPNKIYKEKEDKLGLLNGYGRNHNIILYDSVDMYINKTMVENETIANAMVNIRIEREEYNSRALYYYIKSKLKEKNIDLPKYDDIKNVLYRRVYDKPSNRFLYTVDSFYLCNSPSNKETIDSTYTKLYIGGDLDLEIKMPIELIVEKLNGKYKSMSLINKSIRNYYAMSMDTIYIEDNYLEIAPYEMSKYFHERCTIVDKLYKVKALETIGLTKEISNRWVDGKSIVNILLREDEQSDGTEEYIYPPDSSHYGVSGMYGDDEFGDNYE